MATSSLPLPEEHVAPATPRSVRGVIVGTLLLILVANAAAKEILRRYEPVRDFVVVKYKWNLLRSLGDGTDKTCGRQFSLVLGDSCGNQGISPTILGQELGSQWLNLCTHGGLLAVDDAWMLEEFIARYGPPREVLLVHVYDMWHDEANASAFTTVPLPHGYWNDRIPSLDLSWQDRFLLTVAKQAPLFAAEISLRKLLGNPKMIARPRPFIDRYGYMPVDGANPEKVQRDATKHLAALATSTEFALSTANQQSLSRMVALAELHDFEIYLADGPIWDKFASTSAFQARYDQLSAALNSATRSPVAERIFSSPPRYPASQLTNVDHLVTTGAELYTRQVADALRRLR